MTQMEKLLEDNANGKDDPINFVKTRYPGVILGINHKEAKAKERSTKINKRSLKKVIGKPIIKTRGNTLRTRDSLISVFE